MAKPEDIVERLRKLTSPDAEVLSDSYRLAEIIKLDPAGAILSAVEEEREACAQIADPIETDERMSDYEKQCFDLRDVISQEIRNRKGA